MSNYPNMSYCMCENTSLAMQQILEAMMEQGAHFLLDANRDERAAYRRLFDQCEAFLIAVEEIDAEREHSDFNH